MSSLFGMNAVELTGSDPSPGAGDDSRPVPDEIETFWPITFKRQILIMCTLAHPKFVDAVLYGQNDEAHPGAVEKREG